MPLERVQMLGADLGRKGTSWKRECRDPVGQDRKVPSRGRKRGIPGAKRPEWDVQVAEGYWIQMSGQTRASQ